MKIPLKRKYCGLSLGQLTVGLLLLGALSSCGPARRLEEDQRLLKRITFKHKKDKKFQEDLYSLSKQKPNRKLLGLFKIYLGVYNLYYNKEDSKLKEKIGEAPVVYDSLLHSESTEVMKTYLDNRGYYENRVGFETNITKKNAVVKYQVDKGPRYSIAKMDYEIPIPRMDQLYKESINKSPLGVNKAFDLESMKKERVRIEELMKNEGYYDFSREFVVYKADTSEREKSANLTLTIKNKEEAVGGSDSLLESPHEIYYISKVYVRMDFDERTARSTNSDTTILDELIFTEIGEQLFRYKVISRAIFIRPGNIFRLRDQEATYRQLSSLGVFSYVSIKYEYDYETEGRNLIAFIDLNPRKQKAYTFVTEGTNNGGNLGINGDISVQNRNTFKGAELLQVRLSGGIEAQQLLTDQEDERVVDDLLPFNTIEFGPEISLRIPRFLLPIDMDKFSPRSRPSTTFSVSYNYQRRPDFSRNITNTYMSYAWNETVTKTHMVSPFDFSYIKLDRSAEFDEALEEIDNPFLRNSYTDNLILASNYSFIVNTQLDDKIKNEYFFRFNVEPAGNFLSLITNGVDLETNDDGSENIAGIRYAQYIRSDIDFRYYNRFLYNTMVYRFSAGLGMPYGNSIALPFEKSFYAGGANGIRAWLARDLGPGTLPESSETSIDQIGNMSLQANFEYRFPITDVFEGAGFIDMGNIWNYKIKDAPEETLFEVGRIWDGTAIGVGAGLRLNFSFFILRFDFAAPFKDPGKPDPSLLKLYWDRTNLNFGIGYPF